MPLTIVFIKAHLENLRSVARNRHFVPDEDRHLDKLPDGPDDIGAVKTRHRRDLANGYRGGFPVVAIGLSDNGEQHGVLAPAESGSNNGVQ
jgi:hypothetical protein